MLGWLKEARDVVGPHIVLVARGVRNARLDARRGLYLGTKVHAR